jgi:hypothetical protein
MDDIEWAITEPIDVTQIGTDTYRITRTTTKDQEFRIQFQTGPGGQMLIDGHFRDLGDDFIAYISIIDEYCGQGGTPGTTIRQQPFVEE